MAVVVDSSIALKWVLAERGAAEARALLLSGGLAAPDFLYLEAANVLWRDVRRGAISTADAEAGLVDIRAAPLTITPMMSLIDSARALATALDRSVYDCLYVALASRQAASLATGDRRLADAVEEAGIGVNVIRIGII